VELLRHLLVSAGYLSVECTTDPSTVCAAHRARPYDLILLDIMMPGVDGFEVMAGLRALEPEGCLCVIAVTANGDHKLRALQAGARDFIVKPIDPAEVLARVRNMLEMKILHDESRRHGERMESEVALRTARLKALSNRVLAVQEEERAHISRELHDDLGQSLTALKFGLHRLGGGASYEHPAILAECLATADAVL